MTRKRRTKEQIQQLRQQMYDVLLTDHPQSVRHVFYRMTDPRLPEPVEKSDQGYVAVQRQLTNMRREGIIPYSWLTDATRRGYFVETFASPADALASTAFFYRRSVWAETPEYVEVWCESRSIAGVIQVECERYAVPLYPSGGFASLSMVYQAAELIRENAKDRPINIIYVGDYDPAGVLIDKKIEQELGHHLQGHHLTFNRIAITLEQIDLMSLPTKPAKAGDKRGGFTGGTVEAEAMPAGVLRELLRSEIESFIPKRSHEVMEVAERSERELLTRMSERMRGAA